MRFTVAWANVVSENMALKIALGCFALGLMALAATTLKLAGRKPLVIERACYSRMIATTDGSRTSDEVEAFVREALAMRFDSVTKIKPDYLSESEAKFREQEQQEFKNRDLSQRIIVNHVTVSGDKAQVDADRLFTLGTNLGTVRSALPFLLALTLGSTERTEWNPYGLTLLQVSAPKTGQAPTGGAGK